MYTYKLIPNKFKINFRYTSKIMSLWDPDRNTLNELNNFLRLNKIKTNLKLSSLI